MKIEATLRSGLRRLWLRSTTRNNKIRDARVAPGLYMCGICNKYVKLNETNVHHLNGIGEYETLGEYVDYLFCDQEELIVLCKDCHKKEHK